MKECTAERETLLHAARERAGALVARLPETEALEQHPDPLPPLGYAVEATVEVEVLDRGQLADLRSAATFVVSTHDPARVEPLATSLLAFA